MKSKYKFLWAVVLISISTMSLSCQKQKAEWRGTIEEVDGVTFVKNPKEPMYGENVFNLEEELSVGEAEGREEYMFSQVGSIAVDDKERVYVSDTKEFHIKIFEKDGNYLKSVGRKGQGPGEFERITSIQITPQKELLVFDSRSRRLSFFSLEGEFIKSKSIGEIQVLDLEMNSKGNIIASSVLLDPKTALAVTELRIYGSDLKLISTISASEPRDVFTPFLPFFVWSLTDNDNIIYGYNKTYEFQILDPHGETIKKIIKEYDPVRITEEERKKRLENLSPRNEVPHFHPAFRNFSFDDNGRIFVQTWEKPKDKEGYYYDVFDSEGKYLAKIALEAVPRVLKRNRLYTIEEDKEGYQFVKRYKVTWKY